MLHTSFSSATPSDTETVAAPTGSHRIRLWRIDFAVTLAGTVSFQEGAGAAGTYLVRLPLGDNGGAFVDFTSVGGYLLPPATALNRSASAGTLAGVVYYTTT